MTSDSRQGRTTRIVLLGCGAINRRVAQLLRSRSSRATLVGILVRHSDSLPPEVVADARIITTFAELADLAPDLILEAASREAVREWGSAALRTARRVVISSASALTDDDLLRELRSTARLHGSQLVLSPGAIAGVEALAAAGRLNLHEVRHRIIKHPKSWGAALPESAHPEGSQSPVSFFQGTAREAARQYPLNGNVTVVTALASLGLDRIVVELVSDPSAATNGHEILVSGDFGSMTIRIENRPLSSNPKSSELAALALVRLAENEVAEIIL